MCVCVCVCVCVHIYIYIGTLNDLRTLDVSFNQLVMLPEELSGCRHLMAIRARGNELKTLPVREHFLLQNTFYCARARALSLYTHRGAAHIYTHIHIHIYTYIYIFVHIHIHIHVHIGGYNEAVEA